MKDWLSTGMLSLTLLLSLSGCMGENSATVIAKRGNFNVTVKASGDLASADTAYLSPPNVAGMWRYKLNFMVSEGSSVEKGQVVARFDTNQISDKLKQKRDELLTVSKELENQQLQQQKQQEELKVKLAQREVTLRQSERKAASASYSTTKIDGQKLAIDHQIAQLDLTLYQQKTASFAAKSKLEISIKQRELQYLSAEVAKLESDLQKLTLVAPKAGLFIYGNNYDGDKFAIGDTLRAGQNFAEIPSLDAMIVKAKISERNLATVSVGMPVEIVLDADPQQKFQGKLLSLGAVIQAKAKNNPEKVIEAQIAINEPDHQLMRPGMVARLGIIVETHKDLLLLPSATVSLNKGQATVRIKSMFGFSQRAVSVVAFDEQTTALSEGVSVGEEVLL